MLVLAALLGALAALVLVRKPGAPGVPTEVGTPVSGGPVTSPVVELPVASAAPLGAPVPRYRIGDLVRRGKTLLGKVIYREYSDDHRQWIYRLDCPGCPRGGILESDLTKA